MKIKFLERYNLIFIIFLVSIVMILIVNLLSLNFNPSVDNKVKKVYYADNITSTHTEVIKLFNKKYEGEIEVIPINLPFTKFTTNERKELLARSLRSNNSRIDVFAIDQIWLSRFSKWALDLENYFDFSIDERIIPELLFTCYCEGKLKSIPLYVDMGVLYYRKDLLKQHSDYNKIIDRIEESITWKEFIRLSKKYFVDKPTYIFQGRGYEGLICNFIEMMESCDQDKNEIITIDQFFTDNSIRTASFYHDLIHKYKIAPIQVTRFNEVQSYRYCFQEDIPFFRGWVSSIKDSLAFQEYYKDIDKLGIAALPHFAGGRPKSVFGGWNLMISKTSDDKKAAATFLKFLLSDRVQKIFYEKSSYLPVIQSLYEEDKIVDQFLFEIMKEQSVHRPKIEKYTKYSDILSFYINQAIRGEMEAEEAVKQAQEEISQSME